MRRLYLQFYLTIIAILVIVVITMGAIWRFGFDESRFEDAFAVAGELVTTALPSAAAPPSQQREALQHLRDRLRSDLALYAADGRVIASAGRPLPRIDVERADPGWLRGPMGGPSWLLRLSDGRSLVVALPRGPWRPGTWFLLALTAIAIAVGLGAFPVARRLTKRIERLKTSVEKLGEGDLAARAKVEGKDEVAALAASFNRSASRIEELMRSHKLLLANCSHELRTPLTRINMALALLGETADPRLQKTLKADIQELDQLIEEILVASRLDAVTVPERVEDIDLLALVAEEAARDGIAVEGSPVFVRAERTLLRRLVRNLIDNARRHGGDAAPEITVSTRDNAALLTVRDCGPGIPTEERERIFEPFYRRVGFAESERGSGLGLALVRQIARSHGGDVLCQPADGGGTLFTVRLPMLRTA